MVETELFNVQLWPKNQLSCCNCKLEAGIEAMETLGMENIPNKIVSDIYTYTEVKAA